MGLFDFFRSFGERGEKPRESGPSAEAETAEQAAPQAAAAPQGPHAHDEQATRELFAEIAGHQATPLKNFVIELQGGRPSKDWLEICQPVIGTLIEGAESLNLEYVAQRMINFREAMWMAQSRDGDVLDEETRELLLLRYNDLVEALPETFTVDDTQRRGESIIIHSLLRQIPEVGLVTFEKLYGAGLTSLEGLLVATPDQLEAATGIREALCESICRKLQEHRRHFEEQIDHRDRLTDLVRELRRQIEATEQAFDQEDDGKAESLRQRQSCAFEIDVLLAQMGHVELVQQMRKLAFSRRLFRLEEFLEASPALVMQSQG